MILNLGILLLVLVVCEIFLQIIIKYFRRDFQWLITEKDSNPFFDKIALKKFINNSFDKELGWVRKPNTTGVEVGANSKIVYHIDSNGSRENLVGSKVTIASFGDSYTFGRQVEDFQTWQVRLSEKLGEKVLNYGVGNYGADQAFLYYQRQKIPKTTKIVILGIVPETICRIHSYWKHYLEFGNTFAFKPRYTLDHGKLKLHKNPIEGLEDFDDFEKVLGVLKKYDDFYEIKFKKLQFRFPYLKSYFLNFKRNSMLLYSLSKRKVFHFLGVENKKVENDPFNRIMIDNIKHSHEMYQNKQACKLLELILIKFCDMARDRGHTPLLLIMPQLIDLKIINEVGHTPYEDFFFEMSKKESVIDTTLDLNKENSKIFYTEDLYGGHFSELGNQLVADKVFDYLSES